MTRNSRFATALPEAICPSPSISFNRESTPGAPAMSASGTLVVPHTTFRGMEVKNLELKFENGRSWAGGNNNADAGLSFHVASATLTIDGKKVVGNGELSSDYQVSSR